MTHIGMILIMIILTRCSCSIQEPCTSTRLKVFRECSVILYSRHRRLREGFLCPPRKFIVPNPLLYTSHSAYFPGHLTHGQHIIVVCRATTKSPTSSVGSSMRKSKTKKPQNSVPYRSNIFGDSETVEATRISCRHTQPVRVCEMEGTRRPCIPPTYGGTLHAFSRRGLPDNQIPCAP